MARGAVLVVFATVLVLAFREGFRRDRVLGWTLSAAAALYLAAALLMGLYLHEVRGRDYLAPDEVGYQWEGEQIVRSWRTGEEHRAIVAGGYPTWNAAVIYFWGPSPVPMRIANGVSGVVGVLLAYILASQIFKDRLAARLSALFVMVSPSLVVWGALNLKERPLGMFVTMALCAGIALLDRWSVARLALFAGVLVLLGELRHYYAAIIGWLVLALMVVLPGISWRARLVRTGSAVVTVGLALQFVTGTFLASGMRYETIMRYVQTPGSTSPGAPAPESEERPEYPPGSPAVASGPSQVHDQGFQIGQTSGTAVAATSRTGQEWLGAWAFVLFGRFEPAGTTGRVLAATLAPEWIASFFLLPLACVAAWKAVLDRRWAVALPAGFVCAMFLLLAYVHGDPWSTVRFRSVYWPVFLTLAAGGASTVSRAGWVRKRTRRRSDVPREQCSQ